VGSGGLCYPRGACCPGRLSDIGQLPRLREPVQLIEPVWEIAPSGWLHVHRLLRMQRTLSRILHVRDRSESFMIG